MTTSRKTVETTLNYYDQIHGPKVLNLNAAEAQSYKWIPVPAEITDMRSCDEEFTLDKNGFQLVEFQAGTSGFEDQKSIREQVYPKVVEMLKQVTGASQASAHFHVIRESTLTDLKTRAQRADSALDVLPPGPATNLHVDQSYDGAHVFFKEQCPESYDKLSNTRWAIVNVWLPLAPVTRDNLVVGDWRTIHASQLCRLPLQFPAADAKYSEDDHKNPNLARNHPTIDTWRIAPREDGQKNDWYYVSEMTPGEALLVKCFDSKLDGRARLSPHGAFQCAEDHGPARKSCEFRCFVLWEDQEAE